jgi:hypothetical protein
MTDHENLYITMDPELKTKWVTALRNGEYKQAIGVLRRNYADGTRGHCCLGVLVEISGIGHWDEWQMCEYDNNEVGFWPSENDADSVTGFLPNDYLELVGLPNKAAAVLMTINDGNDTDLYNGQHSFKQIADIIEQNYIEIVTD